MKMGDMNLKGNEKEFVEDLKGEKGRRERRNYTIIIKNVVLPPIHKP